MTTSTARRALAFGTLVVAASVLGLAAPAQAHNYLVSSTPAEGETLTELPAEYSVTTNGDLLSIGGSVAGFAIEIQDAAGLYYGDGCVAVAGPTLSMPSAPLGEPGEYTMLWQLVSADGHTVSGEVGFTWAPTDGSTAVAGDASPASCGNETGSAGSSGPQETHENADLSDVLWIGGAIAALLVAALVTFLVLTRKKA